jgi:hypothetical protein
MGFGFGLGLTYVRWRSESDKPCRICLGLEGDHAEVPPRPHPYCECSIDVVTRFDGDEPVFVREYTTKERIGIRYVLLGIVRVNQGLEVADEINSSLSSSVGNVFLSSGLETGTGRAVNRTFSYDKDMGGKYQSIYDIFGVYVTRKTRVYRRPNGDEISVDEVVDESESLLTTIWVEEGESPHYNEGFSGEGEDGDTDGAGEDDYEIGMSVEDDWDG